MYVCDFLTGLSVCPDLEVFVSSSLDGTICIWNEENHLIRFCSLAATYLLHYRCKKHYNSVIYMLLLNLIYL